MGLFPTDPLQQTASPYRDTIAGTLKIAWWLYAAWFLVALVRSFLIFEGRPRDGKLVQDILSALIYLAAVFAIITYVFDLPIQGLIATSGVIAIILGLALQSSLNDVFSGLVLSFSHPYRPGDWIKIDGGTEGRIVELNWRATHFLTGRQDLAIVPNSTIAKSKIVNVNYPSALHGVAIDVGLRTSPAIGKTILDLALLNSQLILTSPRPTVLVQSIDSTQTEYEVTFFVDRLDSDTEAQNELFDLIFRHAVAAGVRLAPPKNAPYTSGGDEALKSESPSAVAVLSLDGNLREFDAGRARGDRGQAQAGFLRGGRNVGEARRCPAVALHCWRWRPVGEPAERSWGQDELRFGPGDYFGEMGLLTGAPAGATIVALAPSVVYELAKADLRPTLEARPQIAQELGRVLAQRLAMGRALSTAGLDTTAAATGLSAWFSQRVHRLFELNSAD